MASAGLDELSATRVTWRAEEAGAGAFIGPDRLITNTPCGYFLNTYTGCAMRCLYCGTGAQGASNPAGTVAEIRERVRHELAGVPPWESIGVGTAADAYPAVEAELGVTRAAIEVLLEEGQPFIVVTKGPTVLRDLDLLAGRPGVNVQVSISSVDEEALGPLEPGAVPAGERIELVRRLDAAGARVSVSGRPWIPEVCDAAALFDALPSHVPITMGVLDVILPETTRRPYGRGFDQEQLNEAYLAEVQRVGTPDNVGWFSPVVTDPDAPPSVYQYVARGPVYNAWVREGIAHARRLREAHTRADVASATTTAP